MVSLLLSIKHQFPWIWNCVEFINGGLFCLRARKVEEMAAGMIENVAPEGFAFSVVSKEDIPALSEFLCAQSKSSIQYFNPHHFDVKTLARLRRNPSFLMMKAVDNASGRIAGYFFLRCFCVGKSVAGLIVDEGKRDLGIGTAMWTCCSKISTALGFRMYATISDKNKSSLASCSKGTRMLVRTKMDDGYMLVECLAK